MPPARSKPAAGKTAKIERPSSTSILEELNFHDPEMIKRDIEEYSKDGLDLYLSHISDDDFVELGLASKRTREDQRRKGALHCVMILKVEKGKLVLERSCGSIERAEGTPAARPVIVAIPRGKQGLRLAPYLQDLRPLDIQQEQQGETEQET